MIVLDTMLFKRQTQRLIAGTWMKQLGSTLNMVPTTAGELVNNVQPRDLRELQRCASIQAQAYALWGQEEEQRKAEQQVWWLTEWRDPGSRYRVRWLTDAQKDRKEDILDGLPANCFRKNKVPNQLPNDAHIVAEALAVGARLLLTANVGSMDHQALNEWVRDNQQGYGFANHKLLMHPDDWVEQEAVRIETDTDQALATTTVAAYWPLRPPTTDTQDVEHALQRMENAKGVSFDRCVLRAARLCRTAQRKGGFSGWIPIAKRKRDPLLRATERRWPRDHGRWP